MSDSYKRNLAVPFFTQRDNTYVWQQLEIKKIINPKTQEMEEIEIATGPKYPIAWRRMIMPKYQEQGENNNVEEDLSVCAHD